MSTAPTKVPPKVGSGTAPPKQQQSGQPAPQEPDHLSALLDRQVEFTPFLGKEPITLTARMVQRFLCRPTKSGKVCDHTQAVRFVMLCKARGLNPWEGDAYIVGYDAKDGPEFSLITAHQALLKRAEVHPEYDGMESGITVRRLVNDTPTLVDLPGEITELPDDVLCGAWARIHVKDKRVPCYVRIRLDAFNKGFGRWQIDTTGMILKCAQAKALRTAFPNSFGGMYIEGEFEAAERSIEQHSQDTRPATRSDRLADELSKRAGANGQSAAPIPPTNHDHPEPQPETASEPTDGQLFGDAHEPAGTPPAMANGR